MTAAALDRRVLVLNKQWAPINTTSVRRALEKVWNGRAVIYHYDPVAETSVTYDFESWILNWEDAISSAKITADRVIPVSGWNILVPEIVVCSEYRGFGFKANDNRKPKFSRSNLYARDKNTCQFCGVKLPSSELTMDHVVPKSKGGKVTWTNIVLACAPCNLQKGNKSLKESGMKLVRMPFEPKAEDIKRSPMDRIARRIGKKVPKTWEAWLGKMYWSVELKD